jgi:pyridoxine 5-phosphate synthase
MAFLIVELDHLAGLRQAGGSRDPEPAVAAAMAELAGAEGVRLGWHGERGAVTERDLRVVREVVRGIFALCMPPRDDCLKVALAVRPDVVILAPESRGGLDAERGLDVEDRREEVGRVVEALRGGEIFPSLLIDPLPPQIKAAQRVGARGIVLHTGRFCWAHEDAGRAAEYEALTNAAKVAHRVGLVVHAGGGLTVQTAGLIGRLGEIEGLHIGHSLVARAALVGLGEAVREFRRLLGPGGAG